MIRIISLLVAALSLSSCQQNSPSNEAVGNVATPSERANWQRLGDGSQVIIDENRINGERWVSVVRCWGSGPFDCMEALGFEPKDMPTVDWHWEISRSSRPELREKIYMNPEIRGGYHCVVQLATRRGATIETISNEQGELAEQVTLHDSLYAKPWERHYVEAFMRDNNVTRGHPHFNCAAIAGMLQSNTPLAIGTTAFTHEMFAIDNRDGNVPDMALMTE